MGILLLGWGRAGEKQISFYRCNLGVVVTQLLTFFTISLLRTATWTITNRMSKVRNNLRIRVSYAERRTCVFVAILFIAQSIPAWGHCSSCSYDTFGVEAMLARK